MTTNDFNKDFDRVVENRIFKFIARASIIAATTIGGPVAVWTITQTYSTLQTLTDTQAKIGNTMALLEQSVDYRIKTGEAARAFLKSEIEVLKAELRERVRKDEAERDFKLRDDRLKRQGESIEELRRRLGNGRS